MDTHYTNIRQSLGGGTWTRVSVRFIRCDLKH